MNANSFRRGVLPSMSDEDVNRLLWNCTAFPFRKFDLRRVRREIRQSLRAGGGTVEGAIDLAHRELDKAFVEHMKRTEQELGA